MDCPYCAQTLIVQKRIAKGEYGHSKRGPSGRLIKGIDQEEVVKKQKYYGYPRCPECKEFIGSTSEDCDHMTHSHCCKCGWQSEIYKGDFV